jgi:hypothetical protein
LAARYPTTTKAAHPLAATLLWTIVKIAKALKDFHGEE